MLFHIFSYFYFLYKKDILGKAFDGFERHRNRICKSFINCALLISVMSKHVGMIRFSLKFIKNSIPYRRRLYRQVVPLEFSQKGRCIDRRGIPFGLLVLRIARGRNRTHSRLPLKRFLMFVTEIQLWNIN